MADSDPGPADPPTRRTTQERVLDLMIDRVERLAEISRALTSERDPVRLQEQILLGAKRLTNADGGTIYGVSNDGRSLYFRIMQTDSLGIHMGGTSGTFIDMPPVPLHLPDGSPNLSSVVAYAVLKQRTVNIADAYTAPGFDFSGTRKFDARTRYHSQSMLTIPMLNHEHEIVGVLQLLNARAGDDRTVIPFSAMAQKMAEGLASQAAVAMSRQELIEDMQALFEGFVQLIADAIDRKSPYTGGHCRRVTELTLLLADATMRTTEGRFSDFTMSDADRAELNIAALLHDCGKITTPDWVMDKATKLQAVHDRIAEVALRFELLKRDAELELLRGQLQGGDAAALRQRFERRCRELDADLAFLRRINLGVEAMAGEDQEQVRRIAAHRLRLAEGHETPLLSEQEVRNLCVVRGTLNEDERQIIQDHVVATIQMLDNLPYPKHLQRIPEFAGGHHEFVDGSGYPRQLTRDKMSPQARMMAIADIFEALTAADRPYKEPMPLSQALRILGHMKESGKIDPDLFDIFIRQGVWKDYAQHYLRSTQVDQVDLTAIPGYAP